MKYVISILVLCFSLLPLQGISKDDGQNKLDVLSGILAKSQSEKDLKKLVKKAKKGNVEAQYALAKKYEEGSEIPQDLNSAKTWYGFAAKQGHVKAKEALLNLENPSAQNTAMPSAIKDESIQKAFLASQSQMTDPATRFKVDPDDPLMQKGMWKDPQTGLIWTRCFVGESWEVHPVTGKGDCKGLNQDFGGIEDFNRGIEPWLSALHFVENWSLGGYDDWRLPSLDELVSLRHCRKDDSFNQKGKLIDYPGDDGITKQILQDCNSGYPVLGATEIFPPHQCGSREDLLIASNSESKKIWYLNLSMDKEIKMDDDKYRPSFCALAVRGGKVPSFYPQKVAQVQDIQNAGVKKSAAAKAEAEKNAAQLAAQKKAQQEERSKKIAALSQKKGTRDVDVTIASTNSAFPQVIFKIQAVADQVTIWRVVVNRGNCPLETKTAAAFDQTVKLKFGQTYSGISACKVQNVLEVEILTDNGKFVFNFQ